MTRILLCAMLVFSLAGICLPCIPLAAASTTSPCCPQKDQCPSSQTPADRQDCSARTAELSAAERAETVSMAQAPVQAVPIVLPESATESEPDRVAEAIRDYPPSEPSLQASVLRI